MNNLKNILSTLILTITLVSCDKHSEWEVAQNARIIELEVKLAEATQLIVDVQAQADENTKLNASQQASIDFLLDIVQDIIGDILVLQSDLELLTDDVENNLTQIISLANETAQLTASLQATINNMELLGMQVEAMQEEVDAIRATSVVYDSSTGVITIELADGTTTETGDLRGTDGVVGTDGVDGQLGLNGQNGVNGVNGQNGLNGLDAINGQNGLNGRTGQTGDAGQNGLNGQDGTSGNTFDSTNILQAIADLEADVTAATFVSEADVNLLRTLIADLDAEVDAIDTTNFNPTTLEALIAALRVDVDAFVDTDTDTVYNDEALVIAIAAVEANLNGLVDADTVYDDTLVITLIDVLTRRVDAITPFDSTLIDAALVSLRADIDAIDLSGFATTDDLNNVITNFNNFLQTANTILTQHEDDIAANTANLALNNDVLNAVRVSIFELNMNFDALELRVLDLENEVSVLNGQVAQLEAVNPITAVALDLNGDVEFTFLDGTTSILSVGTLPVVDFSTNWVDQGNDLEWFLLARTGFEGFYSMRKEAIGYTAAYVDAAGTITWLLDGPGNDQNWSDRGAALVAVINHFSTTPPNTI